MKRRCAVCNTEILKARLEVLPETRVCVRHSTETKVEGHMDFNHKTAPVLVILPKDPEERRKAKRAFRRAR